MKRVDTDLGSIHPASSEKQVYIIVIGQTNISGIQSDTTETKIEGNLLLWMGLATAENMEKTEL